MGADDHTQEEINATMDEIAAYAKQNGYSTKEYLKLVFGSTMTVSTFKQMAELDDVSSHYMQHYQEDLTYTDSDLESYYAANKDSFDVAAYEYIYFKGTADSTTDSEGNTVEPTDEENAAAKELAAAPGPPRRGQGQGRGRSGTVEGRRRHRGQLRGYGQRAE